MIRPTIGVYQADSGWWHAQVDGLKGTPVCIERTKAEAVGALVLKLDADGSTRLPAVIERRPLVLEDLDQPHPPPGYG